MKIRHQKNMRIRVSSLKMNVNNYSLKAVLLLIMCRDVVLKCSRDHAKSLDLKCEENTCNSTNQISLCDVLNLRLNVTCVFLIYNETTANTYESYFLSCRVADCEIKFLEYNEIDKTSVISPRRCATISVQYGDIDNADYCCYSQTEQVRVYVQAPSQPEVTEEINGFQRFIKKKHFITTSLPAEPWEIKTLGVNGTFVYSGIVFDILKTLGEFLNFDYEVHEPKYEEWGAKFRNGSWSGMIGQIIKKEVDPGIATFTITKERTEVVDFFTPFWEEPLGFVVRIPKEDKTVLYLSPFTTQIWCLILATVSLTSLLIKCADNLTHNRIRPKEINGSHKENTGGEITQNFFLHTFAFMVNQGRTEPTSRPASRMFLSCYWLLIITITAIYTGNLIAFMTMKKIKLPVNTLEDLAHHPEFQAGLTAATSTSDLFKTSKSGVFHKVWNTNLNVNPANFYGNSNNDTLSSFHRVRNEDFVRIGDVTYLTTILEKEHICDLIFTRDRFLKSNFAFATYKGFPYLKMFNERIRAIIESGVLQKLMKKYFTKENKCDKSLSSVGHSWTTISDTSGAFIALVIGIIAAYVVFLIEIGCTIFKVLRRRLNAKAIESSN